MSRRGAGRRTIDILLGQQAEMFSGFDADAAVAPVRLENASALVAKTAVMEAAVIVAEPAPELKSPRARAAAPARVWSVGELVRQVRGAVEERFGWVTVEGEISNWRPAASGHCYFTLKDGASQISAVLFRREAALLRFKPKDGDAVRLRGQVSLYESRGQLQLIAESMELAGIGAQLAAVQELKARLRGEGLFENKRALPAFPRCIGVVTSRQGSVLRDIVKVCRRRHAAVNLLIYPVAVQGADCARQVAAAVRWFSKRSAEGETYSVDVVIVARGGGSWEDLHGFDDEEVARAIAGCSVPVITGIGHATDSTIADAAADICAPTPSAAAELVTAAQHGVEVHVVRLQERLRRAGGYEMLRARQKLSRVNAEAALRRWREDWSRKAQRLDELEYRAESALGVRLRGATARLSLAEARLRQRDVRRVVGETQRQVMDLRARLERAGRDMVAVRGARVDRVAARAEVMSPLRVLERGYALVFGADGKLLKASDDANVGEGVTARLARGALKATVTERR